MSRSFACTFPQECACVFELRKRSTNAFESISPGETSGVALVKGNARFGLTDIENNGLLGFLLSKLMLGGGGTVSPLRCRLQTL
jgi:hypothetical protein